jgi:hypothetical protein
VLGTEGIDGIDGVDGGVAGGVVEPPLVLLPVACVPCGSRRSVNFVPSAVFWSVTGLFSSRVSVGAPVAYEPPTIVTVAVFAVSDLSWKIGFDAGKAAPEVTDSETPFTEMTAAVTGGAGGAGGVTGGLEEPPPEPDEEPPPEPDEVPEVPEEPGEALEALPANGSLLSKSENDCSWPVPAVGLTAETSAALGPLAVGAAAEASGEVPARVGAAVGVAADAAVGVAAGVGVDVAPTGAATGTAPPPLFIDIIVFTA